MGAQEWWSANLCIISVLLSLQEHLVSFTVAGIGIVLLVLGWKFYSRNMMEVMLLVQLPLRYHYSLRIEEQWGFLVQKMAFPFGTSGP